MGDTPRTDAMLGSICGGRSADGVDAVSHEEDYYNKSLKLCRNLERELVSLRADEKGLLADIERLGAEYDALRAEKERAEETARELISLRDMLILCGEDECRDVQGYPQKLRALIDGLIVMRRRAERAEAENTELHKMLLENEEAVMVQSGMLIKAEAERDAAVKDAERFRFRHSNYIDADGYEYGYCKVRWKDGSVESMLWASDEEIDAAIAARKGEQ